MANKTQILDKIKRNLDMLGVSAVRGSTTVTAGNCIISYVDASIQAPMGGIDQTVSPFLGMGVAAPGKLQIRGTGTKDTVPTIFTNEENLKVLRVVCGHANNVLVVDGTTGATVLAELPGSADLLGLGM